MLRHAACVYEAKSVLSNQIKSNQIYFVTQNYTIPIKDGKIEQCINGTQRQLRATLTGEYKPNSITLASSELAPNMFGASSELVPNQLV